MKVRQRTPFRKLRIFWKAILVLTVAVVAGLGLFKWWRVPHLQIGSLDITLHEDGPLHFIAFGDSGKGNRHQYEVAQALETYCQGLSRLDGILLLGDNFYPNGVSGTEDPQWIEKLEKPYNSKCLSQAPIYAVLGNHDYKGNPEAQIAYSKKNPRWVMPHRFYRLQWPGLLNIIALDTNFADFCFDPTRCVSDFFLSRKDPAAKFNIVIAHHPLFSSSLDYEHSVSPSSLWLKPLACSKEIDLWISGHSHHLEYRSIPGCPTRIAVSGGGGASLSSIEKTPEPEVIFLKREFGFLHLEVTESKLDLKFINPDGAILHHSEQPAH